MPAERSSDRVVLYMDLDIKFEINQAYIYIYIYDIIIFRPVDPSFNNPLL